MSKQAKKGCVPVLRFPEFREAREWARKNGNLVFEQISNKQHNSDLPILAITQEYGAIPRELINYQVSVTEKSIETYKVVDIGDFIISLRSFQGGIEYSQYKGICSPAYIILRRKIDVSELYFKHFFKTERFIQQLNKNLEGLRDGKMVSYKQFSDLLLPSPSKLEQQKIAACLSSLDELITAQAQKVEALKTHKKGLMPQLFPAEGETAPKLRFPEFQEAGEWEITTLGNIANFSSGGTPSKENSEYWGGEIPWISAASMYSINIESSDLSITEKAIKNGAHIAERGALLILVRGSMLYKRIPIGIAAKDVAFNQDVKALTINGNIFNYFLLYQLIAVESQLLNLVSATGIGAGKIDTIDLKQFRVFLAPQEEQQKIAACLSSLDELITAQAQKLEALKTHKKGLMQQLFPAVDEVNA